MWEREARDASLACLGPLLADYIWQREPFTLEPLAACAGEPSCLGSSAQVDDCVEDE